MAITNIRLFLLYGSLPAPVAERKKGKMLQAGWDLRCGSSLAASAPKAELRPKAADFDEVFQGVE